MNRRKQPQRVPPPITFGDEALAGEAILRECPDELGVLLWKVARSVSLCAGLPERERATAYSDEARIRRAERLRVAEVGGALHEAISEASSVLEPGEVDLGVVARGCSSISRWALASERSGTALEFAQAAALICPGSPEFAYAVAGIARRRAEYPRAETWYRKAINVARAAKDRRTFTHAWLGFGTLHMLRGNYPAARAAFFRGLRAAKRGSLKELVGKAYHDLTDWATRMECSAEVDKYAQAALEAYGPGHARIPALAHDVAVHWMKRGYFAEALKVFQSIPDTFGGPDEQLAASMSRVRAAGGAGDRATFEAEWDRAQRLLENPLTAQRAASALVYMARGAEMLGEHERARRAAVEAKRLAEGRGEMKTITEAEAILDSVSHHTPHAEEETAKKRPPKIVRRLSEDFTIAMATASDG